MLAKMLERQQAKVCMSHGPRCYLVHWPSHYLQAWPSHYNPEVNNKLFMGYTLKKVPGQDVAPSHQPIHHEQVVGQELLACYLHPCVNNC